MRIIISDIDMGGTKTFMVSREYLALLVAMLENGTPLPGSRLTQVTGDGASCFCPSGMFSSVDGNCAWCGLPITPRA